MLQPEALSSEDSAPAFKTPADQISPTTPASLNKVAPQDNVVPQQLDPLPTQESSPKIALAFEAGVADQPVPTTLSTFRLHRFNPLSNSHPALVIGQCTVQMIKQRRRMTPDETQSIFNILRSIAHIAPLVTLQDDKDLHIRTCLRNILGETNKKVGLLGRYEYSEPLRRNAAILLAGLDKHFAVEATKDDPSADEKEHAESPPLKKRRMSEPAAAPLRAPLLTFDHPNARQVLRGIVVRDNPRVYALDRTAVVALRDCRVFGHNGLVVGQWWPFRICALRDGAHGSGQGGIAGNSEVGAWSVVVSGGYEDHDQDHGDTIYYSGSKSHTNTDPITPILSSSTKAMRVSKDHNRSIRVIRSARSTSIYSPTYGLRYDGLYKIASEEMPFNTKGGAYVRFELVRESDQPPIDMGRPDTVEKKVWRVLKGEV